MSLVRHLFWRYPMLYALSAAVFTCCSAWLTVWVIYMLAPGLIETSDPWDGDPYSPADVFGIVVLVVLTENAVLALLAGLAKIMSLNITAATGVIAVTAALLHASVALAWFFPALISFTVLSLSYLIWAEKSKPMAFLVIFVIHSANNMLAISPYYLL